MPEGATINLSGNKRQCYERITICDELRSYSEKNPNMDNRFWYTERYIIEPMCGCSTPAQYRVWFNEKLWLPFCDALLEMGLFSRNVKPIMEENSETWFGYKLIPCDLKTARWQNVFFYRKRDGEIFSEPPGIEWAMKKMLDYVPVEVSKHLEKIISHLKSDGQLRKYSYCSQKLKV